MMGALRGVQADNLYFATSAAFADQPVSAMRGRPADPIMDVHLAKCVHENRSNPKLLWAKFFAHKLSRGERSIQAVSQRDAMVKMREGSATQDGLRHFR